MLALEKVHGSYVTSKNEAIFLENINLKIQETESLAIIGKKNSGKTALLNCINYITPPSTGIIKFDNFNFTILSKKKIFNAKKSIGYVNENKTLLKSQNVFGNVELPLNLYNVKKREREKNILDALKITNSLELQEYHPKNLNPLQKALVCLARAIVTKPKLLILDEITKDLDVKSTYTIINLLKKIKKIYNLTIIFTTTNFEIIKSFANKIIVLDDGKIVEKNSVTNFFLSPKSIVGKELLKAKARLELPIEIRKNLKTNLVKEKELHSFMVRCAFLPTISSEMIFGEVIEKLDNKINIISAHQENLATTKINIMFIEFTCVKENISKTIFFLNENKIYSKVLGYV